METLLVDYKAVGTTAPVGTKSKTAVNNQGVVCAEKERVKTGMCFACGEKSQLLSMCKKLSKKEKTEGWDTKKMGFHGEGQQCLPPI